MLRQKNPGLLESMHVFFLSEACGSGGLGMLTKLFRKHVLQPTQLVRTTSPENPLAELVVVTK